MKQVRLLKLGRMAFSDALAIQKGVHDSIIKSEHGDVSKRPNTLILVEHEPVYTVGIRTKGYDQKLESELRAFGADFVKTNRGGLITYHGPGQLVAYPILHLGDFDGSRRSIKWYVHQIENTVIEMVTNVLRSSKFESETPLVSTLCEYPGVWIEKERKIAAIGVHASRYITFHGVAINCNIDLNWFNHIIPCGIVGKKVTSLSNELGYNFSIDEAAKFLCAAFENKFNCQLVK
jgi:lipoyl(octanoyl) transferase